MERVLVTGGTGFVGRATVRLLLENGFAVRVLSRGTWPFTPHPRLERCNGSMTNGVSLRAATEECDAVVHLAARKNDERDSEAVNVGGTETLFSAAKRAGVKRVVYVSTQSAALERRGTYGETKLRGEDVTKACGVPFVILRPSLVYGAGDAGVFATIDNLSRLPLVPVFGDGTAAFRPVHVDDVCDAIVAALLEPGAVGKTLDIGGPDEVTFDALIRKVLAMNGIRRRIVHLPPWTGLLGARILRVLPHPPVTRSNVLGGLHTVPMDTRTANDILRIAPRPFQPKPSEVDRDAAALLAYVSSKTVTPTPELTARFRAACAAHGIPRSTVPALLLPYLDAASRLWMRDGTLQKTMLIAAAIAESTPEGADAFLPETMKTASLTFGVARASAAAGWYMFAGTLLWTIPSFRRHAA